MSKRRAKRKTPKPIKPPSASRQVVFHQLLVAARKTWLMDALKDTLGGIDPKKLKAQLAEYVPDDAQRILAAGVPFFFKQWGGPTPKSGGRLLDGKEWSEWPKIGGW